MLELTRVRPKIVLDHCKANPDSAGGEFAQQNIPGAFGTDYRFINESAIDFFFQAGVNTIRVPFLLVSR